MSNETEKTPKKRKLMANKPMSCGCEWQRLKIDRHVCADCGGLFCPRHTFIYVDESNEAITKNSREYCRECYRKRWNR